MAHFAFSIHAALRDARHAGRDNTKGATSPLKEYPRMPRTMLPLPNLSGTLQDALDRRASSSDIDVSAPLSTEEIGALLGHALRAREKKGRQYPSGGALFPIETYVLVRNITDVPAGVHHYHPVVHALEHLWSVPLEGIFAREKYNAWAEKAPAILLFTGMWSRNFTKYGDFGYLLALLEAGHMIENTLLVASALHIAACPLAGFDDASATTILDIDNSVEQPICAVGLGK